MANLGKVIYINEEDYSTLLNGGSITKGGTTYTYDSTALYVIKDVSAPEYAETAGYATSAGQATKATQDASGNVITETYATKANGASEIEIDVQNEAYITTGDTINSAFDLLDSALEGKAEKQWYIDISEIHDHVSDYNHYQIQQSYNEIRGALNRGIEVIIRFLKDHDDDQIIWCYYSYFDAREEYYCFKGVYNQQIYSFSLFSDESLVLTTRNVNYHTHGNITSDGDITATAPTIANGDQIVINDDSASKITNGPTFDGSTTTQALSKKGTWETFAKPTMVVTITRSGTAPNYTYTANKTYTEIGTALQNGTTVVLEYNGFYYWFDQIGSGTNPYLYFKHTDSDGVTIEEYTFIIPYSGSIVYQETSIEPVTDISSKVDKVTSTDNAIARFNGTGGQIQNSGVTINDSNHVTAAKFITSGGTSSQFVKGDGSLDGVVIPQNLHIKLTSTTSGGTTTYSANYTYEQILTSINNGGTPDLEYDAYIYRFDSVVDTSIIFSKIDGTQVGEDNQDKLLEHTFCVESNNTWTKETREIITTASSSNFGLVKLTSSFRSTDDTLAATAHAVKLAYDHGGVQSVNGQTGAITGLAPVASPALTGTPTAPTAASGTNTTQIATTAFVQDAVSDKADKCLVVTITRSGTSPNYTYTANKTYTEIGNALTAGTTVVLSYNSVYYWFTAKGIGNTPDLIFSNTSVDLGNTIEVAGKFFTITTSSVTYWENILTDTQQTLISMGIEEETKSGSSCYFNDASGNELTHAQVAALIEDTTKDIVIIHTPNESSGRAYFRQNGYFANIKGGTKSLSNGAINYFTGFAQGDSKWYNITLTWNNNAFTAECVAISGGSGSGNIVIGFDPVTDPWEFYNAENDQITDSDVADILNNNLPSNIVFYNLDEGRMYYASEYGYYRTIDFIESHDLLDISVHPALGLQYQLISERTNTAPVIITATTSGGTDGIYTVDVTTYGAVTEALGYTKQPVLKFSLSEGTFFVPMYQTGNNAYIGSATSNGYTIDVALNTLIKEAVVSTMGSTIEVDTALSESSTNPVQNRVITAQILENEEIVATALNNLNDRVELKQDQLVSGTTIKTINNQSILGSGNISISGGGGGGGGEENVIETVKVNGTALTPDANKAVNITSVPGSIVTQDTTHRFVSDTEKTTWNGKQNALQYYSESSPDARINVSTDNTGEGSGSHGMITLACRDEMTDQAIAMSEISMDNVSLHHEEYDSSTGTTTLSQDVYIGNNGIKLNYDTSDNQGHEVVLSTNGFTYDNKQIATTDQIPSAVTESIVSGWGFTKNAGTITGITMNGSSKGTSGVVNLGTVVTSETDPVFTASAASGITSSNIATWNGKYTKPSGGIPDTDLTTAVNVKLLPTISGSSDIGKIARVNSSYSGYELVKPITVYSGSSAPSSSTGSNGDIYIQTS